MLGNRKQTWKTDLKQAKHQTILVVWYYHVLSSSFLVQFSKAMYQYLQDPSKQRWKKWICLSLNYPIFLMVNRELSFSPNFRLYCGNQLRIQDIIFNHWLLSGSQAVSERHIFSQVTIHMFLIFHHISWPYLWPYFWLGQIKLAHPPKKNEAEEKTPAPLSRLWDP